MTAFNPEQIDRLLEQAAKALQVAGNNYMRTNNRLMAGNAMRLMKALRKLKKELAAPPTTKKRKPKVTEAKVKQQLSQIEGD